MSLPQNLIAALTARVMKPLVCGGELRPLPPIGPKRALEHAEIAAAFADFRGEDANEIQWQRLRVARRLCAIDRLEAPSPAEWLLSCALNDLLQATNPDLPGLFGRDRPLRLIHLANELIEIAGAPRTIADALSRHTSFSRVLELVRFDTHVSWWVGSRSFRGATPPSRLLAWERLRRVRQEREEVPLAAMAGEETNWAESWHHALGRWLAASPVTDLATVTRSAPQFAWTGATLGLLATAPGRNLGQRALARAGARRRVLEVLEQATQTLASAEPRAAELTAAVAADLAVVSADRRDAARGS